jgi:hypothetical protein
MLDVWCSAKRFKIHPNTDIISSEMDNILPQRKIPERMRIIKRQVPEKPFRLS